MIVFLLRGRAIETQAQLARSVQQKLLPETGSGTSTLRANACPRTRVGRDFYDGSEQALRDRAGSGRRFR